jgi:hypothetical protein
MVSALVRLLMMATLRLAGSLIQLDLCPRAFAVAQKLHRHYFRFCVLFCSLAFSGLG